MNATELIGRLRGLGVTLQPRGEELRYHPRTALTSELIDLLRAHKPAVLATLRGEGRLSRPRLAFQLFAAGHSVAEVMERTGRTQHQVETFLIRFVEETQPESIEIWVEPEQQERILAAVATLGERRSRLQLSADLESSAVATRFDAYLTLTHHKILHRPTRTRGPRAYRPTVEPAAVQPVRIESPPRAAEPPAKFKPTLKPEPIIVQRRTGQPRRLADRQALLSDHVRLVCRGYSTGLLAIGPGGLGKSFVVGKTLRAEGVSPVLVNSQCTPLALYRILCQSPDSLLWLDDCESVFTDLVTLGLLRSALWAGEDGRRVVTYHSTRASELPNSTVFHGRIVACANAVPLRAPAFKALLSRIDAFQLDATNDELLAMFRELADDATGSLSAAECHEVCDFLENFSDACTLNVRLWEQSLRKREFAATCGVDWRPLVAAQLERFQ